MACASASLCTAGTSADVDQYLGYFTDAATLTTWRRCLARAALPISRLNDRTQVKRKHNHDLKLLCGRHCKSKWRCSSINLCRTLLGHAAISRHADELSFHLQLQITVVAQRLARNFAPRSSMLLSDKSRYQSDIQRNTSAT